jgi:hypothetical protein
MAKKVSSKEVNIAIAELNKVRKNWLRRPGVTAVDVGFKIKDMEMTDQLAIRVHVKRKIDDAVVSREAEDFTSRAKPKKQGDFPIDVIEADYVPAQVAPVEIEAVNRRAV